MPNISIIYERPDFLVINKPAGLIVHPKNSRDTSESVISWLLANYPGVGGVGDDPTRPGIVHRLDKETSGLMIIAKTPAAFDYFKNLFQARKIKKSYLAMVWGQLAHSSGIIETPLGKLGIRQTTRIRGKRDLQEKTAVTEYKLLRNYGDYSLLEVSPQTGRTHQIRVHLKSIGHPLICDRLYAGKRHSCPPELGRLFLHAQKLSFTAPDGQSLTIEVGLPPELGNFLQKLQENAK